MKRKGVVFLDRDGVINEEINDYVTSWDGFIFKPRIFDILKMLKDRSVRVMIVTNQSCIAKGILSIDNLENIHQSMIDEISKNGGEIEDIYCCPHRSEDNCACRKPRTGMFIKAEMDHSVSLLKSIMIGDDPRDILAGYNAGCRTILTLSNRSVKYGSSIGPNYIAKDNNILYDILEKETRKWK